MQNYSATTPFGRRPYTLEQMRAQVETNEREDGKTIDKWKLFDALKRSKDLLGISDRALTVLNALLTFHRSDELSGDEPIIVFPSNKSLALRAHGMSETTLRTYLSSLVALGLIIRRDSPNGKRYARKGQGGDIDTAYGFDLGPLLARADEFMALAKKAKEQEKQIRILRERITICRRDIDKMITTGHTENVPGDWNTYSMFFSELNKRLPRKVSLLRLETLAQQLEELAVEIFSTLEKYLKENSIKTSNIVGNDSENGGHKHNSTENEYSESELSHPISQEPNIEANVSSQKPSTWQQKPKSSQQHFPLAMVLQACPEIAQLAPEVPINSWRDLVSASTYALRYLGISLDAWEEAVEVLGPNDAAIVVAAILQRTSVISKPGGYLRVLTQKARAGCFSIGPILKALLRANLRKAEKIQA